MQALYMAPLHSAAAASAPAGFMDGASHAAAATATTAAGFMDGISEMPGLEGNDGGSQPGPSYGGSGGRRKPSEP
jgi:hypothetical protein